MKRIFIKVAKRLYEATPSLWMRQKYFALFCRLVRGRKVRATIDGATYDLDLDEIIEVALFLGQWEPEVGAALNRYCAPGMTVLDIGANIGAHTLNLSRIVASSGAVYAFEPTDFAFPKLVHNLGLNNAANVRPVKLALSDVAAYAQVVDFRASWKTNGARADGQSIVDFVRLDDWCAANNVDRIDLIKIDIDGGEFAALAGGVETLTRDKPAIVIEAFGPQFADESKNPFVLLRDLGYRFFDAKSFLEYTTEDLSALLPDHNALTSGSRNVIALHNSVRQDTSAQLRGDMRTSP